MDNTQTVPIDNSQTNIEETASSTNINVMKEIKMAEEKKNKQKILEKISINELEKILEEKKIENNLNEMPKIHTEKTNYELFTHSKDKKKMYNRIKNGTYWADEIVKLTKNIDDYEKIMDLENLNDREYKYYDIKNIYNIKKTMAQKEEQMTQKEENMKNQEKIQKIIENKVKIEEEIKKGTKLNNNNKFKLLNNGSICENEVDFNIQLNEMECKEMSNKFGFEPMTLDTTTPSEKCVVLNTGEKNYVYFNNTKNSIEMSDKYKQICKLNNESDIK